MNYEFDLNESNLKDSLINNKLNRNSRINNLMKLINSLKRNTIIAIDGAWGTGKTVFVKQLETLNQCEFNDDSGNSIELKGIDKLTKDTFNNNHGVYYYNAWENDLHNEPLQSLLLFLLNELPKNEDMIVDFSEFKKNLPSHIYKIIGGLGSGVIKGLNDKAKDLTGIDIKETVGATIDLVKDINDLKDYKGLTDSIITTNEIKQAINDLINDLLNKDSKIVFIIDELDRCRPDYAVRLLETITHFYDNDKIVFLVSCNSQQLSHTISKFYGNDFDSYGYLNKIFNFMVSLENVDPKKYIQSVLKKPFSVDYFDLMALSIFEYLSFTMREIGRYLYYMDILTDYYYHDDRHDNSLVKCSFMPYLLGLKLIDIKQYNKFINGNGLSEFMKFYKNNKNCKTVVDGVYSFSVSTEEQKTITVEEYVKDIYSKYFVSVDNDKYFDKAIKERLLEVLSLISNFSSLT